MMAAVAVETVVLPWAFVVVMGVGMNAIGEGGVLDDIVERLVDIVIMVWPCALLDVTGTAMAAAWLVVTTALPCALVVVTGCGTRVAGALAVIWEKVVERTADPSALVELCITGMAAIGAVETMVLPCAFVEVTATGTIVAEGGAGAWAAKWFDAG